MHSTQILKKAGFTLLELLVVIAIIGILAAIVIGSMVNARFDAQATSMVVQLKQIERAMQSYSLQQNNGEWMSMPNPSNHEHSTNLINHLIDSPTDFPGLDELIGSDPVNYSDAPYTYFNREGTYQECLPSTSYNVNNALGPAIKLHGSDQRLYDRIDLIIDGTIDPDCGRVKKAGGSNSFYFELSEF